MGNVVRTEPCPSCRARGQDRKGNNLAIYKDEGSHCFACGFHKGGKFSPVFINEINTDDQSKATLPRDFQRQIPAEGWRWLLQYGLSYTYWSPYCGYSPSENRAIITSGQPIRYSQGRALTMGDSKWRNYGRPRDYAEVLGAELPGEIVLVEDVISQHKVAQVNPCICLFGTAIHDVAISALQDCKRPVVLWLDEDQYQLLPRKINRLQALTGLPVRYVKTERDPKSLSTEEIKDVLEN